MIDAWELVDYAKAVLTNQDLLRAFEHSAKVARFIGGARLSITRECHDRLNNAHALGRFSQMRRLHPRLTDEALENRIARIVKRLDNAASMYSPSMAREAQSERVKPFEDLKQALPKLLRCLAETFLCEGRDGSIRVRARLLAPWQDLVLVFPPLLITSAWMAKRISLPDATTPTVDEQQQALTRMRRWLCESTLPVDDDPFLDHLCRTEGLDETHMHLNGTTEAEKVWCDALERPEQVVGGLTARTTAKDSGLHVSIGNGVERLLLQEDPELTPDLLLQRVEAAVALKAMLLSDAVPVSNANLKTDVSESAVAAYRRAQKACLPHISANQIPRVAREAWQLVAIMRAFEAGGMETDAGLVFWYYALLRAQFCRLLVQQVHQKGFDQFQYITLNELREATEKDYAERFRQIERAHQKGVDFLEGRFAPKSNPDGSAELIGRILRGYLEFLGESEAGQAGTTREVGRYGSLAEMLCLVRRLENGCEGASLTSKQTNGRVLRSARRLRLGLVPHFIKRADANERNAFFNAPKFRPMCRDVKLRQETDQCARALVALIRRTTGLDTLIRGIDAASNERHAGPEVFAPVFRRMRGAGIRRFTYHAGEDFAHLISGLRAITEAVYFLELDAGCRIGHGTASGLDPKAWWAAAEGYVVMPTEDRLDDLVFAREILLHARVYADRLPVIEAEIHRLSMRIWSDPRITPEVLADAWRLRSLDPLVQGLRQDDVDPNRREEVRRFEEAHSRAPVAHAHFLRRHGKGASSDELKRAREDLVVSQKNDVLRPKVIRAIQNAVLQLLQERCIAIETLPSSNVRISIHNSYEEHHALHWLGLDRRSAGKAVSVVIGSDDPGIFATGLRMEYAHLLRTLNAHADAAMNISRAEDMLQSMCTDAKRYRF
ncbi:adenosine deaminase [Pseudomonas sp. GM55]|nr:adenosine deaminase [Pseudomonas sp. GM55]